MCRATQICECSGGPGQDPPFPFERLREFLVNQSEATHGCRAALRVVESHGKNDLLHRLHVIRDGRDGLGPPESFGLRAPRQHATTTRGLEQERALVSWTRRAR